LACPSKFLSRLNIKLGINYPEPIVNHIKARKRALEAYDEMKNTKTIVTNNVNI